MLEVINNHNIASEYSAVYLEIANVKFHNVVQRYWACLDP